MFEAISWSNNLDLAAMVADRALWLATTLVSSRPISHGHGDCEPRAMVELVWSRSRKGVIVG